MCSSSVRIAITGIVEATTPFDAFNLSYGTFAIFFGGRSGMDCGLRAENETVKFGDTFIEGRGKWESLDGNGGSIARSLSGTRWTG
jgi:hypothetical protein